MNGNRITVTENRISGAIRTELAKHTKNDPIWTATPETGDEEDANASEMAEKIMRALWKDLAVGPKYLEALEWSKVVCIGFLKTWWDPSIGDKQQIIVGPEGKVMTDPVSHEVLRGGPEIAQAMAQEAQSNITSKTVAKGDVRVEVRSPFQVYTDPGNSTFEELEWLIDESVKSKEYVKQRFGQTLEPDTPMNPGLVESRLMGRAGKSSYKGIKIREWWCRPNDEYPNGASIVWAKGKQLDENLDPFDPFPYVMFESVPVPGRLHGLSTAQLLLPVQTELNKTRSQMAENRNRFGNPTLAADKNSIEDPEDLVDRTMQPGGVLFYTNIGATSIPQWMIPPPMPAYVQEMPQQQIQAIEDISGQHEVTNASVPPGVTAASAITLLQEADDTRLGLAVRQSEHALSQFGCKVLELVQEYYTDSRLIRLAGDDGAWEIFDFRGKDLRGNTHIDVEQGSQLPQSLAAKQALTKDILTFLMESGNAPHGRQLAQFLKDVGMGATDRLVAQYTDSETQINRENALMAQGQVPMDINAYDDDQDHIDGHESFQRQPRYTQLNPMFQQGFEQHVTMHRQRLQQAQQQQMETQMAMQGQTPPAQVQAQAQQEQAGQQQQQVGAAQQQGYDAAGAEQDQRQGAEQHAQRMTHAQQVHEAELRHKHEVHQANLRRIASQAQQQRRPSNASK